MFTKKSKEQHETTINTPIIISTAPSKGTAILLALFLGGLGAHKFYLGKNLMGVIYLLFCWTFIPAILGALEALNYMLMSQKTFQKRYTPKIT